MEKTVENPARIFNPQFKNLSGFEDKLKSLCKTRKNAPEKKFYLCKFIHKLAIRPHKMPPINPKMVNREQFLVRTSYSYLKNICFSEL